MIRRILVVLDGSARAERVIPYGISLGRAFGSEVVLQRVVEESPGGEGLWTDPVEWRLERSEAVTYLEGVKERFVEAGIPVDIDVGVGDASDEILETARARRIDLVALTTHGRGGATGVPLAGTAHKVIAGAPTSILLVPAGDPGDDRGLRRVLVGLDGSLRAEWALRLAATVARTADVPLVVAYVVPAPEVMAAGDPEPLRSMACQLTEESRKVGLRYLADVSDRLRAPDLRVSTHAVKATTSVPRALAKIASEEPDALLVLSARGSSAVKGCVYGSVAGAMVQAAEHPILVLQDGAPVPPGSEPSPESPRWRRNPRSFPTT